jgi:hypothetical protein
MRASFPIQQAHSDERACKLATISMSQKLLPVDVPLKRPLSCSKKQTRGILIMPVFHEAVVIVNDTSKAVTEKFGDSNQGVLHVLGV